MTKINPGAMNLNAGWIEIGCVRENTGNRPETANHLGDPYGNRTRVSAVKGPRPNR